MEYEETIKQDIFTWKELSNLIGSLSERIDRIKQDNERYGLNMQYDNLLELREKIRRMEARS